LNLFARPASIIFLVASFCASVLGFFGPLLGLEVPLGLLGAFFDSTGVSVRSPISAPSLEHAPEEEAAVRAVGDLDVALQLGAPVLDRVLPEEGILDHVDVLVVPAPPAGLSGVEGVYHPTVLLMPSPIMCRASATFSAPVTSQ
jgi:hypothetical protein